MPPMRLVLAVVVSSLLHAALIVGGHWLPGAPAPRSVMLEVSFQQDLSPAVPMEAESTDPTPTAPAAMPTPPIAAPPNPAPQSSVANATPAAAATVTNAPATLLYPPEAVRQGIEGDVTVLLVLNDAGHIVSADIARGSGHAVLDAAALQAARRLGALPGNPRQTLLPVTFRLQ